METCSTPDRGYMGNPRRGASLGRSQRDRATMADLAREDIARLESTLRSFAEGFEPGWYDADGTFTPNFPTPESRADWIRQLEARRAEARQRLTAATGSAGRFHLRRVRLDAGGYDSGGAYWGHGGHLYEAFSEDGVDFTTVRVGQFDDREAAKEAVREVFPAARFLR